MVMHALACRQSFPVIFTAFPVSRTFAVEMLTVEPLGLGVFGCPATAEGETRGQVAWLLRGPSQRVSGHVVRYTMQALSDPVLFFHMWGEPGNVVNSSLYCKFFSPLIFVNPHRYL